MNYFEEVVNSGYFQKLEMKVNENLDYLNEYINKNFPEDDDGKEKIQRRKPPSKPVLQLENEKDKKMEDNYLIHELEIKKEKKIGNKKNTILPKIPVQILEKNEKLKKLPPLPKCLFEKNKKNFVLFDDNDFIHLNNNFNNIKINNDNDDEKNNQFIDYNDKDSINICKNCNGNGFLGNEILKNICITCGFFFLIKLDGSKISNLQNICNHCNGNFINF
jgi:hypothetical protein